MEKSTPLCNGRESNADKVKDSETTLLVSKKGDKNDLVDSEKTPHSLLQSQLQAERHQLAMLRQEAEGLRKSLEHSDAYFLVQQQALEDLSAKQEKVNKLAKHLASIMGYPGYCFLSTSEVVLVLDLFCCGVYMLLCSLYLHWWRTLMPSGCNMCNSRDRLA